MQNGSGFLRKSDDSLDYLIADFDTKKIDEILRLVLKENKTEYIDSGKQDSKSFVLLVYKGNKALKFYVNSEDYPNSLKALSDYLTKIKNNEKWKKLQDSSVKFESLKYMSVNPNIDNSLKFDPPHN